MKLKTEKLLNYNPKLVFFAQDKKLASHFTSLISPLLDEDYADKDTKTMLIDKYTQIFNITVKMIKRDFNLEVSTGELVSVLLQHPFFQTRWFSPLYCRDYEDSPKSFKDFFASGIQNGLEPKWCGDIDVEKYVTLGMKKGKFSTVKEFKTFIEKELLPNSGEVLSCGL